MNISVVIPCHNGRPYLAQAIRSVLDQTRGPQEVLVVDDASTDNSASVAQSFGDRVRVESKTFKNAARTRSFGASLAGGDAIMFMDADDVLAPDALEALGAEVERKPHGIAACPWFRLELKDGRWLRQPPSCNPRLPGQDPLDAWLRGWYHPPCSVLWSRAAYQRVGDWDPEAGPNDDGEIMMRALVMGTTLHLTSRGAAFYRRMPEGAESLSGSRFSEGGLRARIHVVVKTAQLLEERGRLDPYRAAIGHALSRIMWDAENQFPGVVESCRTHRRTFGEPAWQRIGTNLLRKVQDHLTPAAPGRGTARWQPTEGEQEEIRYGLGELS